MSTATTATTSKKLTGWAQAAARSAPPAAKVVTKKDVAKEKLIPLEDVTNKKKPNNSNNNHSNYHSHNHKKHSNNRQPYNRNEVRSYMKDLFTKYSQDNETVSYKSIVGNNKDMPAANWGTVQSKNTMNKNKKYSLLAEVATVLKK